MMVPSTAQAALLRAAALGWAKADGICSPHDCEEANLICFHHETFNHWTVMSPCSLKPLVPAVVPVPPGPTAVPTLQPPLPTGISAGLRAASQRAEAEPCFFPFTGTWLTDLVMISQKNIGTTDLAVPVLLSVQSLLGSSNSSSLGYFMQNKSS